MAEDVENRNSSFDREPKQALNSIFKILNAWLQFLQLNLCILSAHVTRFPSFVTNESA